MLFVASSCEDFLTQYPEAQTSEGTFYKTLSDFNAAVVACYAGLRSYPATIAFPMLEYRSDNLYIKSFTTGSQDQWAINKFIDNSSNTLTAAAWRDIYSNIFRCNQVISRIDNADFDANKKTQFEGEARFVRAFYYYNLVRIFGDVPIIDKPITANESLKIPRGKVADVYKLVETDLLKAIEVLPENYAAADLGRVRSSAAKTLLAKVYLAQKKYPEAKTILNEIITNAATYSYQLLPVVADVFNITKEMNKEVIFAIRFSKTLIGGGHGAWLTVPDPTITAVNSTLSDAYESNDARGNLLKYTKTGTVYYLNKFTDSPDATTQTVGNDYIVLRFADVLLMYSECLNEISASLSTNPTDVNGALYWLNLVRTRSNPNSPVLSTQYSTKDDLKKLIFRERRLEFPLEGSRWYDLVHTKTAKEAMSIYTDPTIDVPDFRLIYPVPNAEMEKINDAGIFPQNPGY